MINDIRSCIIVANNHNHEEKEPIDYIIHCDTNFDTMISILHLHTCSELVLSHDL